MANIISKLLGGLGIGMSSDGASKIGEMMPHEEDEKRAALKGFMGAKKGGKVSSASKRGDGIAQRGKTRGKLY
jgi:hypothetical protein